MFKTIIHNASWAYFFIGLSCILFIVQAIFFPIHDFSNYYFGGDFLKRGLFDSSIYFPHEFNKNIAELGYQNLFVSYAPNSPFLALIFTPFTFLSLAYAKLVFNIISLVLFIYSLRNLVNTYELKPIFLFIIPLIFFIPLRNGFLFGQTYLLLFFLLAEGFLAYKKNLFTKMSLFWSLAILIKVFPIILFGFLFFKRKYKSILYLSIFCFLLLCISIFTCGIDIWVYYFQSVLPKSNRGEIAGEFVQNYQSFYMLFKGFFPEEMTLISSLIFLIKILLLVLGFYITTENQKAFKAFIYWILLSLIISPYGSTYSLILLLFPFLHWIKTLALNTKQLIFFSILLFLISNSPVHYFSNLPLPFSFPRLILLIILIIYFIKPIFHTIKIKYLLFILIPALVGYTFFIFENQVAVNSYSLADDKHLLKYDYEIVDDYLNYRYWDQNGSHINNTGLFIKSLDTNNFEILNHQIQYNNVPLTLTKANYLKPALVNDSCIIFLSDFKQGIGFYQLYYIPVN